MSIKDMELSNNTKSYEKQLILDDETLKSLQDEKQKLKLTVDETYEELIKKQKEVSQIESEVQKVKSQLEALSQNIDRKLNNPRVKDILDFFSKKDQFKQPIGNAYEWKNQIKKQKFDIEKAVIDQ